MRRVLLTLLPVLLLAVPAGAGAATVHVVRGAGWGHGIGMSQYGAFGYARHGRNYEQILTHYYTGTRLSSASGRSVRVLLLASRSSVKFRGVTHIASLSATPRNTYTARRSGGRIVVFHGSHRVGSFASPLRVWRVGKALRLIGRAINGVRSGRYRGSLLLSPGASGGVTAVNSLPLDPYVQGVVPGEMPSSWSMEALKAQAVAARSYGLATRKRGGSFDEYPDTRSQAYEGVAGEARRSNSAVRATSNQVLTSRGRVATTYFFSTSGGHTENIENSFQGATPQPYLRGVSDPFDSIAPRHRWRRRFSGGSMQRRLGGYVRGRFRRIKVTKRGVSPRIVRALVIGTRGSRRITGPALRSRLGLFDTWARFIRVSTSRTSMVHGARFGALRSVRYLAGQFDPAPGGLRLVVERQAGGRWRRAGVIRTTGDGQFGFHPGHRGLYRVRSGSVAGPAVRV